MSDSVALDRSPAPVPGLRVSLLGSPQLTWQGRTVSVRRRECRALLYRLAAQRPLVSRSELAFLFWPDSPETTSRRNLTSLLVHLRRALPSSRMLLGADDSLGLDWSDCSSDLVAFEEQRGHGSGRVAAVDLVRGPFLAGFSLPGHAEFEAWAEAERSALERMYLEALGLLVCERAQAGDYRGAIVYARRYLATDELAEEMYRWLIGLSALTGEWRAAGREFKRCQEVLDRELSLEPSAETCRLDQAVREGASAAELCALLKIPPADQPGAAIQSRPRHNLPVTLTPFVGRQAEVAELWRLLTPGEGQGRLVTLTGPGGCGKTRLAVEVARELAQQQVGPYPDGVWWVDLAPLSDPLLVRQAVASALGIAEQGDRPLIETLQERLRERRLLLVLDNCEHLLEACGEVAEQLLATCPHLVVFATSREAPLGVEGERQFMLGGLSLPGEGDSFTGGELESYEAVQLFLVRAAGVRRDFALTAENAQAVRRVCVGLDGLPLALELAAARLTMFTVHELAARLHERFRWLTDGGRRALARHQTLEAAIDWSYQLLTEGERSLLLRLSVFAGGFTLQAAEALCFGRRVDEADTLSLLTRLVDKCLVKMEDRAEQARFRLLETIRQYGWERLREAGEGEAVQQAHARYYAELCLESSLRVEPDYAQLAREIDNVRAALTYLYAAAQRDGAPTDCGELLLNLSAAFAAYCWRYSYLAEGREWCERVLNLSVSAVRYPARGWLLFRAGLLHFGTDFPRARAYLEESVGMARQSGDRELLAPALCVFAFVVHDQDGPAVASPLWEEALSVARALGDKQVLLFVLLQIGQMMHTAANDRRIRAIWEEFLAIARELKDEFSIGWGLEEIGVTVNFIEGHYRLGRAQVEQGLVILQRLGVPEGVARSYKHLSHLLCVLGELGQARQAGSQALGLEREMGEKHWLAYTQSFLALITYSQGDVDTAAPLAEEAITLARALGARGDMMGLAWGLWGSGRALSSTAPDRARAILTESLSVLKTVDAAAEMAWVFYFLGWLALMRHEKEVLTFAQQAWAISQERNYPHPAGWARLLQGEWARLNGEHAQAAGFYDQAEEVLSRLEANGDLALLWHKRGWLAEAQGDPGGAAALWGQSLALARTGDCWAIVSANLRSLARLALALDRVEWAAQLLGAAEARKLELVWSLPPETQRYRQDSQAIRERLGEKRFAASTAVGREMQPEQVDALADRVVRLAARFAPASAHNQALARRPFVVPLTPRELEVLGLVSHELSDAEIGERLVVSPRTVGVHLGSIYRKLGVSSRVEAARAARECQLI